MNERIVWLARSEGEDSIEIYTLHPAAIHGGFGQQPRKIFTDYNAGTLVGRINPKLIPINEGECKRYKLIEFLKEE